LVERLCTLRLYVCVTRQAANLLSPNLSGGALQPPERPNSLALRCLTLCAVLLVACLLLAITGAGAAWARDSEPDPLFDSTTEPLLTLIRSSTAYDLIEDQNTVTLDVQVRLRKDVGREDLEVQVVDVLRGRVRPAGLTRDFVASLEGTDVHPSIRLTVNAERGMQPGTYDVLMDVARRGSDETLTLSFQLTHPPAAVPAPPTAVIDRTLGFWLWSDETEAPSITFEETSGLSRISEITVEQIGQGTADGKPVAGRVLFAPPGPVSPGTQGTATVVVPEANYPLGTTTATAKIKAPQLQSPVQFPVEVRTRRAPVIILWVVALALILGWFTRTFLQRLIDRGKAKMGVIDLLDAIRREKNSRKDDQFHEDVRQLELNLEAILSPRKSVEEMTSEVAAIKPKFATALSNSDTRRQEAMTKSQELLDLVRPDTRMPPALASTLAEVERSVETIREHLSGNEITAALAKSRTARTTLSRALHSYATEWKRRLTPLETDPDRPLPRVAPRVSEGVQGMADLLTTGLAGGPDGSKLITNVSLAYEVATGIRRDLTRVSEALTAALAALGSPPPKVRPVAEALTKVSAIEITSQKFAQEPGDGTHALAYALTNALRATGDAILAQLPDNIDPQPITDLIGKGEYLFAADQALRLARPVTAGADREGRTSVEALMPKELQADLRPESHAALIAEFAMSHGIRARNRLPLLKSSQAPFSVTAVRAQTRGSLILATTLQLVFLGALLLWAAWVLYADTFVGTAKELATIFIWAFAIDLSVGAVVSLFPRRV
jgi:hypothetical protein